MSRPANYFKKLAGVPVHYDRFTDVRYGYGTKGKPYDFFCTKKFQDKLDACFQELWNICPHGKGEVITSAGAYVDKPGSHGMGRGFDLDGIFWPNKTFITINYPTEKEFYLGVEAVLRKHFGTVLNHLYNNAHQDHFHIDDTSEVKFFTSSRSRVLFLQATVVNLFEKTIDIDGDWGPKTRGAITDVLQTLGIQNDITDLAVWLKYLDSVAKTAFGIVEKEKNPLELLQDLYKCIDDQLQDSTSKKTIESALALFIDHLDTQKWLKQYNS
jgi:hypothetical protein